MERCSLFERFLCRKPGCNGFSYPTNTDFPCEDYYKHYSNHLKQETRVLVEKLVPGRDNRRQQYRPFCLVGLFSENQLGRG